MARTVMLEAPHAGQVREALESARTAVRLVPRHRLHRRQPGAALLGTAARAAGEGGAVGHQSRRRWRSSKQRYEDIH